MRVRPRSPGGTPASRVAGEIVAVHGTDLTIEAGSIAAWARVWGRAVHAFTSGLLITAIQTEVAAITPGGQVRRAGTRPTAMSQHCLCSHQHKKPLSQRTHRWSECGLTGGRDAISAVLAACPDHFPRACKCARGRHRHPRPRTRRRGRGNPATSPGWFCVPNRAGPDHNPQ